MTAPGPYARCGKRAVPPDTGYMAPSSACTKARRMAAMAPSTQAMIAAPPMTCAAPNDASSQPEPMIDVSDDHMAEISPSSRLRPTSPGLTVCDSVVAMIDSSFLVSDLAPKGMPNAPAGPAESE